MQPGLDVRINAWESGDKRVNQDSASACFLSSVLSTRPAKTPKPTLTRGFLRGRYWDRTSDLCRVKAYRVVSGTPAAPRRTAENPCPAWVFSVRRCASVCGVSHPFADHARTRRGPSSRKRRTAQPSSHPKRDGRRGSRTWLHPRPRKVGPWRCAVESTSGVRGGSRSFCSLLPSRLLSRSFLPCGVDPHTS